MRKKSTRGKAWQAGGWFAALIIDIEHHPLSLTARLRSDLEIAAADAWASSMVTGAQLGRVGDK
jgi:hypothetical protein